MPAVGLGTWQPKPQDVYHADKWALAHGYRHMDTAFGYGNEKEVGDAIKDSGVPREEIWSTTKLDNRWHTRSCSVDPDRSGKVVDGWTFVNTWREIQKLPATGKVRNIGVSNMGISHLETLLTDSSSTIVPVVNQIELHPAHPSPKLLAYSTAKGIHSSAYSPLGSTDSKLCPDETIVAVAKAKGCTSQQVLLLWGLKNGTSVLPKSVIKERIESNFDVNGRFALSDEGFTTISAIPSRFKVCSDGWLPEKVFFGDDEYE